MTKNPREQEVYALADRLYFDDGLRRACAELLRMEISRIGFEKNKIELVPNVEQRYFRTKQLDQVLRKFQDLRATLDGKFSTVRRTINPFWGNAVAHELLLLVEEGKLVQHALERTLRDEMDVRQYEPSDLFKGAFARLLATQQQKSVGGVTVE